MHAFFLVAPAQDCMDRERSGVQFQRLVTLSDCFVVPSGEEQRIGYRRRKHCGLWRNFLGTLHQKYFDLVAEGDYLTLLKQNAAETISFFEMLPHEKHDYKYEEGKWTIKEVFMHIIDTERVFSYRGLTADRGDASPHYRMDEELYARNVDSSTRTLQSLISAAIFIDSSTRNDFRQTIFTKVGLRPNTQIHLNEVIQSSVDSVSDWGLLMGLDVLVREFA